MTIPADLFLAPTVALDGAWDAWERRLDERRRLELNPRSAVAIKRDVHTFAVSAPARAFVDAFHRVMMDPARRSGLVRVVRKRARVGKPFALGEKFQGRFCTSAAVDVNARGRVSDALRGKLVAWLGRPAVDAVLWPIESELASDFGEITELALHAEPGAQEQYRLAYRYLEGSYIAGSSTFIVDPIDANRSRLTQVFEYQEISARYVHWMGTSVVRLHNQVVYGQVKQSAALIGARILHTDVPDAYAEA